MKGKRPGGRFGRPGDDAEGEDPICTKIFFVSRTHTQLTQAVSELRRIKLSPSPSTSSTPEDDETKPRGQTRSVPLGSRKNLCINDELITSLRKDKRPPDKENGPHEVKEASGAALDEACRDLNTRTSLPSPSYHIICNSACSAITYRPKRVSLPLLTRDR